MRSPSAYSFNYHYILLLLIIIMLFSLPETPAAIHRQHRPGHAGDQPVPRASVRPLREGGPSAVLPGHFSTTRTQGLRRQGLVGVVSLLVGCVCLFVCLYSFFCL